MWKKEKQGERADARASLYYLVCVHTLCMVCVCVCVRICVFPGSREAKQRLTSSRRPWVCVCLPLCKMSHLLMNPMRLKNAAARVRGRVTRHPGKTRKAGGLAGRYGTRRDDDRNRNTSSSTWALLYIFIIEQKRPVFALSLITLGLRWYTAVDQIWCIIAAARVLQVTSLQRLGNVLSVKLNKGGSALFGWSAGAEETNKKKDTTT